MSGVRQYSDWAAGLQGAENDISVAGPRIEAE